MGSPKKGIRGRTRDAILKSAVREFIDNGYEGARMQRIADASKANKAMIYYYFHSKEDIYNEVLKEIVSAIIGNLNTIPENITTVRQMMEAMINAYQDFLGNHPDHIKLVQYEIIRGGQNLRKLNLIRLSDVPFNPINGRIYHFFRKKMQAGEIRKMEIIPLIFTIIGSVVVPFIIRPLISSIMGDKLPLKVDAIFESMIKGRKDYVIDLVMDGLRPRTDKPAHREKFRGKRIKGSFK